MELKTHQSLNPEIIDQCAALDEQLMDFSWPKKLWQEAGAEYKLYTIGSPVFGLALYHYHSGDQAHLLKIMLRPEMRGQGAAQKLFAHSVEDLKKLGVSSIFLEVAVKNIGAQKFYEKLGMEQVNLRKKFYSNGEDAYFYLLKL